MNRLESPGSDARAPGDLILRDLSKVYAGVPAVEECNLTIHAGEFITLLGPSGSGKTTILRMVAGFTDPTSGQIELDGVDITNMPPYRRNLGMVFQNYALFPHMTAAANIAFPLRMRGIGKAEQQRRVVDALKMVRLEQYGERRPRELSGGQQQRIALARALVFNPRVLLMDEPLGALDKRLREGLQVEIRRLHQDLGITIIFVTHDQEEALALSDRIAIMRAGQIEQLGSGADLYERPASMFVADFMGESNVFRGVVQSDGSGRPALVNDGLRFTLPAGRGEDRTGAAALVIRPERLAVRPLADEPEAPLNRVRGTLVDVTYLGPATRFDARAVDGTRLTVRTVGQAAPSLRVGDDIWACWAPEDAVVLADAG